MDKNILIKYNEMKNNEPETCVLINVRSGYIALDGDAVRCAEVLSVPLEETKLHGHSHQVTVPVGRFCELVMSGMAVRVVRPDIPDHAQRLEALKEAVSKLVLAQDLLVEYRGDDKSIYPMALVMCPENPDPIFIISNKEMPEAFIQNERYNFSTLEEAVNAVQETINAMFRIN